MSDGNGDFPETFIPNRPAEVDMVFDRFTVGTTRDGDDKPIAVGEIDGVERSVWLLGTALRNQFRKVDPQQGELIHISYAGAQTKSGNGRQYWNDRVSAPGRPVESVTVDHPLFKDDDEMVDDHGTPITY
jgi:hypothetical protein